MPSITYWSQLLPSPRAPSVAESLAARVRDPAWFLARQWQLGEFQGADAGSPAFVRIASHTAQLATAQLGAASATLSDHALIEPLVEQEPLTPDLATRVELGQTFELLLAQASVATAVRDQFRAAYAIAPAGAAADAATTSFLRVCAGRTVDGVALYHAARAATDHVPPSPALDAATRARVAPALNAFVSWVDATWGDVSADEPPAWDPARLEYRVAITASSSGGGRFTLSGRPDALADFDWHSFDLTSATADPTKPATTSVLPGHVRFRGMPNARWWDIEGSKTDFGAIVPDTRDLARLLFMDFLLLHGDDWFLAPLDVPAGSLAWIDALTVTDVFGVATTVPRADATPGSTRWTMFSSRSGANDIAPFLLVPSTASAALLTSPPIEDVHLLRDETADMAWAIEHVVEGATGQAEVEPPPPVATVPADAPASLVYQLATPLPSSWFPLLPQQVGGAVMLVAGTVEGAAGPRGRIVQRLRAPGFQLPDAEVPRSGVRVQRVACRARSPDGHMHLWIARRTRFGAGAASSGLRYDQAVPRPLP
ncbi:MAG: hypothetical protein E6J91_39335 [Deltaproteobacteria bacterium]|nr:MAG: hypothetical protein E6J91_39335 [Deltaproteobacteria bacterium]